MTEWNIGGLHGFLIWCFNNRRFRPAQMRALERAVHDYLKRESGGVRERITKGGGA